MSTTEDETLEVFESVLREIDRELGSLSVPVRDRAFEAVMKYCEKTGQTPIFTSLDPRVGPLDGPNLPRAVQEYFDREYHESRLVVPPLGTVPVRIRGAIFSMRIPVVVGKEVVIDGLSLIDGLTEQMKVNLSAEETPEIQRSLEQGYQVINEVEDFGITLRTPGRYTEEAVDFFASALRDRDAITPIFLTGNTNQAVFHGQQHAEKMIKGAIITEQPEWKPPRGHAIKGNFRVLTKNHPELQALDSDIDRLNKVTMTQVRYRGSEVSQDDAYELAWAALRVGAAVTLCLSGMEPRRAG